MLVLALPVFFASCNEEVDPNDPVIQREVAKRTEVIREELKTDQDIRHTIRLIAVCMLAGGTLFGLYRLAESGRWFSSSDSPASTPSIQGRRKNSRQSAEGSLINLDQTREDAAARDPLWPSIFNNSPPRTRHLGGRRSPPWQSPRQVPAWGPSWRLPFTKNRKEIKQDEPNARRNVSYRRSTPPAQCGEDDPEGRLRGRRGNCPGRHLDGGPHDGLGGKSG